MPIHTFLRQPVEDITSLLQSGLLDSLYQICQTEGDFRKVRWWRFFHDAQGFGEFRDLLQRGFVSLAYDSLGVLLQTMNFNSDSEIDSALAMVGEDKPLIYRDELSRMKEQYGIDVTKPCFYVQGMRVDGLTDFVDEWFKAQGPEKRWNPGYAPVSPNLDKVYDFCRGHSPTEVLNEFDMGVKGVSVTEFFDDEDSGGEVSKWQEIYAVCVPFDGWTLARCLQLSYERPQEPT